MESTLVQDKSTHKVPVIEVKLLPHDNANALSCVKVKDYICVVATKDWKDGDLAAWIPPDSIVDISSSTFSFLTKPLIRAKRLRGVISYGLLVPAPDGYTIGQDVAEVLGVTHYDPEEEEILPGKNKKAKDSLYVEQLEKSPSGNYPKYDVDSFLNYGRVVFSEGEPVIVTEKIHGENARFVCVANQLYAGSRNTWKREFPVCKYTPEELLEKIKDPEKVTKVLNNQTTTNKWWKIYDSYPGLKVFCLQNAGYCVYGELYGSVKEMKYGCKPNENKFAAFDILGPEGTFLDYNNFKNICDTYNIPRVPELGTFNYNMEHITSLTSGKSLVGGADHIREGIVVKPIKERWNDKLGRVCLKLVSIEYYEKRYQDYVK